MNNRIELAKKLAKDWYFDNLAFFKKIQYPFSWDKMGEIAQEYWLKQADKPRK